LNIDDVPTLIYSLKCGVYQKRSICEVLREIQRAAEEGRNGDIEALCVEAIR
jgi:hypothetical protein